MNPPPAVLFDDLHSFDPITMVWRLLSPAVGSRQPISARFSHGFTSLAGTLYMHGGATQQDTGDGKDVMVAYACDLKFHPYTPCTCCSHA
jgi:hypothetical protein